MLEKVANITWWWTQSTDIQLNQEYSSNIKLTNITRVSWFITNIDYFIGYYAIIFCIVVNQRLFSQNYGWMFVKSIAK